MKMKLNKTTFLVITLAALFIQLLIITYNHYTGLIYVSGILNFVVRLAIGTFFSTLFGLLLVYIDLMFINPLDKILPLPEKLFARIPAEVLIALVSGALLGMVLTTTSHIIFTYEDGLQVNLIKNGLIVAVINLIVAAILEAVIWFKRNQQSKVIAEQLEKENAEIRFETLKGQLNPHFLFNSLNVLSSLIGKDAEKAREFVDEFSMVYRYTLDVIDKQVVELSEEVEFVKAFLYLQKIRFGEAMSYEINIYAEKLSRFVPPLALQTLLENCFKHNRSAEGSPLRIKIYDEENFIFVVNNLQMKNNRADSKGIGLNNLKKRYALLSKVEPEFSVTENEYIAKIPLIESE